MMDRQIDSPIPVPPDFGERIQHADGMQFRDKRHARAAGRRASDRTAARLCSKTGYFGTKGNKLAY